MLVSAKEMLDKAKAGKYAVGQFNINNLEWTKSILQTAQECNSPVILGVSEGAGKYMCGFKTVAAMVKAMVESLNITVPVALHLDHGSYEGALNAMEAGFSSVMFDGSHYPIDENIEKTKEIIRIAGEKGISVEAEVGAIGGEEDGVVGGGEVADPDECKMIADLGVDMLAAGIGNIHGVYPRQLAGPELRRAGQDPGEDRHHAPGAPRRHRHPRRDGEEGHLPGRLQGEREHRVPAGLRRRHPEVHRGRQGPAGQGLRPPQAAGSRRRGHQGDREGEDGAVRLCEQGLSLLPPI